MDSMKGFFKRISKPRNLALLGLIFWMASSNPAFADSPFAGVTSATTDIKSIAKAGVTVLGAVVTAIGGSITAFKASQKEDFTQPLIFAIVGTAVAAVAALV